MNRDRRNPTDRSWVWALIGLVIGGALGSFVFQGGSGRAAPEQQPLAREIRMPVETPEERELRGLKIAAHGAEGQLTDAVQTPDGWALGIEMPKRPVQVERLERDALRMFREIKRTGARVANVVLVARTDQLKDVYGHPLKDVVLARIGLTGETFARINWDGFDPKNFPRVADELWLHDELLKQMQQRLEQEASQGQAGQQGGQDQGGSGGGGAGGGEGGVAGGG
ncbi:MAG: hypothetical protein C0P61_005455 [Bacillota bacterium]